MKCNYTALNANSFVNQCQNIFIKSADNRQSYDKYMDYLHNAEHCRPNSNQEFLIFDIENATKRLNLSNTLDCDLLNVRHILYAHPSIYVLLKLLYHNMLLLGILCLRDLITVL